MSSAHENSWSWIEYLAKTVDKLTHGVTSLVSTAVGLTCNLTDFVIGDETQQKFSDFSNELVAWLTFDDFQLQLLKIFLLTFVSTVALIFIAWHIYGARISEHFMEQNPVSEERDASSGEFPVSLKKTVLVARKAYRYNLLAATHCDIEIIPNYDGQDQAVLSEEEIGYKIYERWERMQVKLSESTSATASAQTAQPVRRVEPTEEAKIAGQAALARLEAKGNDTTRFNTSYAAIKAQVKRELEQERNIQRKAQKEQAQPKTETKHENKDSSLLAVAGVYFRCPYLSSEILSQDEWKRKIREFLYEQLKGEEAGLTACLIIQNCNIGRERVNNCVDTLGKYLENIINNPEAEKYRKIRMHNRIFQDKVLPIEGTLEFLNAAGFRQMTLPNNDIEEDFMVWDPENCDLNDLTMLCEALKSAETIPLELDRNLQVLLPMQASERNELPPSFFNITSEEIKREQQLRSEAVEVNQMLRTKAMRERNEKQSLRKYKFSLIRIRFPDNIILQGTFSVHENFKSVVDFVSENLANNERPFTLRRLTGLTFNEESFDKALLELELFPAALLIFTDGSSSEKADDSAGYLKEELLSYIQSI